MDVSGKTAVITGGATGFGRGFATALLENGANICINDLDFNRKAQNIYLLGIWNYAIEKCWGSCYFYLKCKFDCQVVIADVQSDKALETVNEFHSIYGPGRAMFMKCDVRHEDDVRDVLWKSKEIYGYVDIMVNNAGISDGTVNTILINLHGVILGTRYALQVMSKDDGGRGGVIVNIASTAGLTIVPWTPVYAASKFGVIGYSRCIAARPFETTEQHIRVVCLCPSFTTGTEMSNGEVHNSPHREQLYKMHSGVKDNTGLMEVPRVVSAFMKLVTDAENNGGVLTVTPKELEYKYPRR